MIYTARKNGHTRTFSDADGMKKLLYYRRNRWQISASLGRLKTEPYPVPRDVSSERKPQQRRESRFVRVMGYRVVLE